MTGSRSFSASTPTPAPGSLRPLSSARCSWFAPPWRPMLSASVASRGPGHRRAAMNSGDVFAGHYRLAVKTAVFRDASGQIVPAEQVADIPTLLASVPPDNTMRANYPGLLVSATASPEEKLAATP